MISLSNGNYVLVVVWGSETGNGAQAYMKHGEERLTFVSLTFFA